MIYEAHLDSYRIAQPSEFTYYEHLDQTYFQAPIIYYAEADEGSICLAHLTDPQEAAGATFKTYYLVLLLKSRLTTIPLVRGLS